MSDMDDLYGSPQDAFKSTHAIDIARRGQKTVTVLVRKCGLNMLNSDGQCVGTILGGRFAFVYELLGLKRDEQASIVVRPYVG